jgi:hypothetical protein
MKKCIQLLILVSLLAGCSGLPNINFPQFNATPTAPRPTDTKTPSASETPIPTQNLFATSTATPLTYTPTVTMIGADLFTPTMSLTPTKFPTITPGAPVGAGVVSYFTPQNVGFVSVLFSYHMLYWDEGPCMPREVKISAFVDDVTLTDKVLLFMRLRSKKNTLELTDWGAGAIMNKAENGSFNYTIHTWNLHHYYYFVDAWIEYQLVAYDEEMNEIGRTQVYDKNITLAHCGVIK